MNTNECSFNTALGIEAVNSILIGQLVEVEVDRVLMKLPVISKDTYTITVQGETNRILCPIGWTKIYRNLVDQKGSDQMTRVPPEVAAAAPKPGRPPKSGAKGAMMAPVEHPAPQAAQGAAPSQPPANHYLPPGSTAAPTHAPPAAVMAQDAETARQWVSDRINAAMAELSKELDGLFETLLEREPEPAAPVRMTCADCQHGNLATGLCDKFSMAPPMKVIANAQAMCPDFLPDASEEVPYS